MPENVDIAKEWSEIARELWQREYGLIPGQEVFTSSSGLVAASIGSPSEEEGVWDTVIRKNGQLVLHIQNARPVSFNPTGDVLLLIDAAADDDVRHFLIKPAANLTVPAFGKRVSIGGRFVNDHKWSEDGKSITLVSDSAAGGGKPETVVVADHLTAK
jgi:hypothetical protein